MNVRADRSGGNEGESDRRRTEEGGSVCGRRVEVSTSREEREKEKLCRAG